MDLPPRELAVNGRRPNRALLVPALIVGTLALLAAAAVLDWPKSEPQARRQLTLRAAELEAWLRQELLAPQERAAFTVAGGAPEAAPAWRTLFVALEALASRGVAALPPLAPGDDLTLEVETAIGARRFTPFQSIDELLDDDWPRRARLLGALVEQAPAPSDGSLARWLDVALVFATDLRSTGLIGPTLHAARIEEVVARRLARLADPLDPVALIELHDHALAARAELPPSLLLAEREQRLLQSSICMLADIPPFQAVHERLAPEESWPLVAAAIAVEQLEGYDDQLALLLAEPPSDRARAGYDAWAQRVIGQVPRLAALLADGSSTVPLRATARRLERIAEAAASRAPGIEPGTRRQ